MVLNGLAPGFYSVSQDPHVLAFLSFPKIHTPFCHQAFARDNPNNESLGTPCPNFSHVPLLG